MQARKHIGKELLIRCAKAVASRGIPISLASAPAEQLISTCCAFRGPLVALCQKHLAGGGIKRLLNCAMFYLPKFPLVQDIKIAGINTSVRFHDKIAATAARSRTGACRLPHCKMNIVIEQAHAGIVSFRPVAVPLVK